MNSEKDLLRKAFKEKRKALSSEELNKVSLQISARFQEWMLDHPDLNHFHIFLPIAHQYEVNTYLIKDFLLQQGKSVYTSVASADSIEMKTVLIDKNTEFELDKWKIPIPLNPIEAKEDNIQAVLIPLLVFDEVGNRIGFGKGYYDFFLSKLNPSVLKIGLSLFDPVAHIPSENHDIPLDYCFTGEKVFTF
ncbi:5-formyltetrahydrofolate cyclo-ligase [Algoriphagus pacificus]|uniref:5-formyltetrahydrofolate cyclo-ligase n=1 Tax=Algoriphagus pacificus TaxID=2811234 RepID=A0ABS3CDA4_9BACT|nr:5-formyltetrahydrofolate cyclo-ligase [Algoriphagus pacificus]MBN7814982.1 5-formyltetrahydrofolate cyclo-ligase [Algoriphagus pacificus]